MEWIILALITAILLSAIEIIDKFILNKEIKDPILATTFGGFSLFVIFIFVSLFFEQIALPTKTIVYAIFTGVVYNTAMFTFYYALSKDEVSTIAPIISTVPLFVTLFAFLFLNETHSSLTYLGIVLIVFGAGVITYHKHKQHIQLKKHNLSYRNYKNLVSKKNDVRIGILFGFATAILFALRNILLKITTQNISIWSVFFWIGIGGGLSSILIFMVHHPHIKKEFKKGIEHIMLVGVLIAITFFIFTLAISKGPVSLVSALTETVPFFVFIIATLFSIFFPRIIKENLSRNVLIQKLCSIILIIAGAVLLIVK